MNNDQRIAEIKAEYSEAKAYGAKGYMIPVSHVEYLLSQLAAKDAEIERLTEAHRWIPVTERLPDEFCDALLTDGKDFFVGFYRPDADAWDNSHMGWVRQGEDENGHANCVKITHWMPLPAAPEKGE